MEEPRCDFCKWSEKFAPMYCTHPDRHFKWADFNRDPGEVCGPTGLLFGKREPKQEGEK